MIDLEHFQPLHQVGPAKGEGLEAGSENDVLLGSSLGGGFQAVLDVARPTDRNRCGLHLHNPVERDRLIQSGGCEFRVHEGQHAGYALRQEGLLLGREDLEGQTVIEYGRMPVSSVIAASECGDERGNARVSHGRSHPRWIDRFPGNGRNPPRPRRRNANSAPSA